MLPHHGMLPRSFLHAALVLLGHRVLGQLVACMHTSAATTSITFHRAVYVAVEYAESNHGAASVSHTALQEWHRMWVQEVPASQTVGKVAHQQN
jgi:hypothetical protein